MLHKMFHTFDSRQGMDDFRRGAEQGNESAIKQANHILSLQAKWCVSCKQYVSQIEGCSGE